MKLLYLLLILLGALILLFWLNPEIRNKPQINKIKDVSIRESFYRCCRDPIIKSFDLQSIAT